MRLHRRLLLAVDGTVSHPSRPFRHCRSKFLAPTLKEVPVDAAVASHQLLLRAGFIRKVANGVFSFLPFALRSISKITNIVDTELSAIGCQKLSLPILTPRSLWDESGRWSLAGDELFRMTDRRGSEYCLAPTHEEVITSLVAADISSYKSLPLRLYQIGPKFRDEVRPRFGLLRGREFLMKDLYTFDVDSDSATQTFQDVMGAYRRLFSRIGVTSLDVDADTGIIGGKISREFHFSASTGEDAISQCDKCGYAANIERAIRSLDVDSDKMWNSSCPHFLPQSRESARHFIDALTQSPSLSVEIFKEQATNSGFAVIMDDRHSVNLVKIARYFGTIGDLVSSSISDCNEFHVCVDVGLLHRPELLPLLTSSVTVGDFHKVNDGDKCPSTGCSGLLRLSRGIEVGHCFYLGDKYSKIFRASFRQSTGSSDAISMQMGCYGIGITRVLAAVVECCHDDRGICWPAAIAPFRVSILFSDAHQGNNSSGQMVAASLYDALEAGGFSNDVIIDDRQDASLGFKMKDAELIGFPYIVIIGRSWQTSKLLELQIRSTGEKLFLPIPALVEHLATRK